MADNALARCVICMHDNKADVAYNKANQMADYRQCKTGDGCVGVYIVWSVRSKDRPYLTWILKLKSIMVGSWLQDNFPPYFHFKVF
jgi:hypothetical protein